MPRRSTAAIASAAIAVAVAAVADIRVRVFVMSGDDGAAAGGRLRRVGVGGCGWAARTRLDAAVI